MEHLLLIMRNERLKKGRFCLRCIFGHYWTVVSEKPVAFELHRHERCDRCGEERLLVLD
jgi:hypothetical protein